jgi:hypothetical protein
MLNARIKRRIFICEFIVGDGLCYRCNVATFSQRNYAGSVVFFRSAGQDVECRESGKRLALLCLAPLHCFRHNPAMKKISVRNLRPHSSVLVDGPERAAARAMLYPVGFTEEDFKKPIIGIASTWSNVTPCNMHIDKLALEAEKGANEGGGKAIVFNTITISDGISMSSEGMKYSLVSREVIADSIETVVG